MVLTLFACDGLLFQLSPYISHQVVIFIACGHDAIVDMLPISGFSRSSI